MSRVWDRQYMDKLSTVFQDKKCKDCPDNSNTNQQTQVVDVKDCVCNPGFHFSEGQGSNPHSCTACAPNTYKASNSNGNCTSCPDNSVTDESNAPFTSASECLCKKGFQADIPGVPCTECPKDFFKDKIISELCTRCPKHSTTDNPGSTDLADCKCAKGYARVNNQCEICPEGSYAAERDQGQCTKCPSHSTTRKNGKPFPGAEDRSQCVCDQGYRKQDEPDGSHTCIPCATDGYSQDWNAKQCVKCPSNSKTLQEASTSKSDCLCLQGYRLTGKGDCSKCHAGTFNAEVGKDNCVWCEDNTLTLQSGSTKESDCVCDPGYFYKVSPASASSTTKPAKCHACPANFYKSESGDATTCTACPANTGTVGKVGQKDVSKCECDPGFYHDAADNCIKCPVDTFKGDSGNGECQSCPAHSSSGSKIGLDSQDDCLCDAEYFLTRSKKCRKCSQEIPNCLECKPRPNMKDDSKAAICTKVPEGYTINDKTGLPVPNKCNFEYEFGSDTFPEELDISHCLQDAVVEPVTGILCQPKCKSSTYQTKIPLREWVEYKTSFCDDSPQRGITYATDKEASDCQKYCESWPDCFFFGYVTNRKVCQLMRNNQACTRLDGVQSGVELQDEWYWYKYDGMTDAGFKFLCKPNGQWSAVKTDDNKITTKEDATEFFNQCELAPTTTTTTTTTTTLLTTVQVDKRPTTNNVPLIIGVIVGVLIVIVIVVAVVIVVLAKSKKKEEEEKGRERRGTEVATQAEIVEITKPSPKKQAGDASPADAEPMALNDKDNLPT